MNRGGTTPLPPLPVDALESAAQAPWGRVPVIGWWIADLAWKRQAEPFRRTVAAMLAARTTPPSHGFPDPGLGLVAARCGQLVAEEIGWPNARFHPDDPLATILWAHEDGLDDTAAIASIEAEFGITLDDATIHAAWTGTWEGFVTLVARLAAQVPAKNGRGPATNAKPPPASAEGG